MTSSLRSLVGISSVFVGTLLSSLLLSVPCRAADANNGLKTTVFLEPPDAPEVKPDSRLNVLLREIARQSFLLAARNEFKLQTRDGGLGEPLPNQLPEGSQFYVHFLFPANRPCTATIARGPAGKRTDLGSKDAYLAPGEYSEYIKLVIEAEVWSRTLYVDALKKAGFVAKPGVLAANKPMPAAVDKYLRELNLVSQFAALRELHDAIQTQGESPALLEALVRAYANLGLLTEHHWNASSKVFKARALLHAQRLAIKDSKSVAGLWSRAYASALAGLHQDALTDLAEAQKLGGKNRPDWVEVIDAYCRFDAVRLRKVDPQGQHGQLAALLLFFAVEDQGSSDLTLKTGNEVLKNNPECYRVYDAMMELGGVSNLHPTTTLSLNTFARAMPTRIAALPRLPTAIKDGLNRKLALPVILEGLVAAGYEVNDPTEPSFAVLGRLAQETAFTQVWRRANFMKYIWSVPVDDFITQALPLVAGHRYEPFIRSFAIDAPRQPQAYRKAILEMTINDLDLRGAALNRAVQMVDPARASRELNVSGRLMDDIYHDRVLQLRYTLPVAKLAVAKACLRISPHSPVARANVILLDPNNVQNQATEWEKTQHPAVQKALGQFYKAQKRPDDAVRCLEKAIKLSPDGTTFEDLAALYLSQNKEDLWLKTLEEALKQEDHGLDHARMRVQISTHFMEKKEWKKAQPYADSAAETWAAWAMENASECHEGLTEWKESELWVRRKSERYQNLALDWYFWCRRTGQGDVKSAQKLAESSITQMVGRLTAGDQGQVGVYRLLTKQPQQALDSFTAMYKQSRAESAALLMAAAADETGNNDVRNQGWNDLAKNKTGYGVMAGLFLDTVAKGGKTKPDMKALEANLQQMQPDLQTDASYFIGRFLIQRGATEDGQKYLARCATATKAKAKQIQVLAGASLRDQGIDPAKVQAKP